MMHYFGLFMVVASLGMVVLVPSIREMVASGYSLAPEITLLTFIGFFYPIFLYLYALIRKNPFVSRDFFKSQVMLASSICVSLGLMGTFIGLAQMVSSIATGMNTTGDFSTKITALLAAIGQSLDSMSLAFVTSIIGVGASMVLVVACNYIGLYFPEEQAKKSADDEEALRSKGPVFDPDVLSNKLAAAITSSLDYGQIDMLAGTVNQGNKIQSEILESLLRLEKLGVESVQVSPQLSVPPELIERFAYQDAMTSKTLELIGKLDNSYTESIRTLSDNLKNVSGIYDRLIDEVSVIGSSLNRITHAVEVQENSSTELRSFIKNLVDTQKISVSDLVDLMADLKYLLLPPLEDDLKSAMEQDSLDLKFQPRFNLRNEIRGFEVFLYWNHPVRGEVLNSEIFGSKIKTNPELLKKLDQWVISKALQKLSGWIRTNIWNPNWTISLNVTHASAEDLSLLSFLRSTVERYRISPHFIAIEIKEGSFTAQPDIAYQQVVGIQEIGMEVYVDNYGLEAASLIKFSRMGITRLKVDKVITQCLIDDVDAPSELRAILASANQLNFEIIADGVERDVQYEHLKKVGFDLFQGNFLSEPINDISQLPVL
jgi:EAL domain-containing protein (putative c-di-GMP-specific phosphodiesterase class I)